MSDLTPKTRALLEEARAALRPSDQDRERVAAALRTRLGAAALPLATSEQAAAATATKWSLSSAVASGVACAALIGGLVYAGLNASPRVAPLGRLPSEALSAVALAPPPPTAAPAHNSDGADPVARTATSNTRRADRLAQEVAILTRAARELRSGRAREALRSLDEHERRFPAGILAEERRAAKAQALCSMGRVAQANAELSQLAKSAPQSASAARARQFCATRRSVPR